MSVKLSGSKFGFQPYTVPIFDGESSDSGDHTNNQGGDPKDPNGDANDKLFTQKQLEDIVSKRVAKLKQTETELQKKNRETVEQLEKIRQAKGLSDSEKNELQQRIDELQSSLQTKEEQEQTQIKRLRDEYTGKVDSLTSERDRYKTLFESTMINNSLLTAAEEEGAENPAQIQAMFSHNVELVQDQDDEGKPLESYTPVLTFQGLNKEKKQETMKLPVKDALKKLREDNLNSNLFKGHQTPGAGSSPIARDANGKPKFDPKNPPRRADYTSTAAWDHARREWKKKYHSFKF